MLVKYPMRRAKRLPRDRLRAPKAISPGDGESGKKLLNIDLVFRFAVAPGGGLPLLCHGYTSRK